MAHNEVQLFIKKGVPIEERNVNGMLFTRRNVEVMCARIWRRIQMQGKCWGIMVIQT